VTRQCSAMGPNDGPRKHHDLPLRDGPDALHRTLTFQLQRPQPPPLAPVMRDEVRSVHPPILPPEKFDVLCAPISKSTGPLPCCSGRTSSRSAWTARRLCSSARPRPRPAALTLRTIVLRGQRPGRCANG
jgi:hypothetical protein